MPENLYLIRRRSVSFKDKYASPRSAIRRSYHDFDNLCIRAEFYCSCSIAPAAARAAQDRGQTEPAADAEDRGRAKEGRGRTETARRGKESRRRGGWRNRRYRHRQ